MSGNITKIEKNEETYSITIKGGKFTHIIEGFTIDDLTLLRDRIDEALKQEQKKAKKTIWNPRSKRHEIVDED